MTRPSELPRSYVFLAAFVIFAVLVAWIKDREYHIVQQRQPPTQMGIAASNMPMQPDAMPMADKMPLMQQTTDASANVQPTLELTPTISYELRTNLGHEGMTFLGVGGAIEGQLNPILTANPGDIVQITLVNGDGVDHNIALPDFNITSTHVISLGVSTTVVFAVDQEGSFVYFCTLPGHRQAGMEGKLIVGNPPASTTAASTAADIVREPTDLPAPLGNRPPTTVRIDLKTVEVEGQLAEGVTYTYWTFDGKVPGPFLRIRQGDTVELHLTNEAGSHMAHSIDLHAVTGPGGGAAVMQVAPGQEKSFSFTALNPGLYVYHCATPMVAEHIANGMYGLILVEPEGGLPPVAKEFYVMQGELYTEGAFGAVGHQLGSSAKLLAETPDYFVFNGAAKALTQDAHALHANVGDTVRIYFGVGGPNFISSFHVIGEIFDRVYDQASLTATPLTNVQTTLVPTGGATMVEFKMEVPGRYILVDHSLSRMEHGLVGFLYAEGDANPALFHEGPLQ